jgi:integrase/recombinase XerC
MSTPTIGELLNTYERRMRGAGRSKDTIASRLRALRTMGKQLPDGLLAAGPDDFIDLLGSKRAAWTRSTYDSALRSFFAEMVQSGRLPTNPMLAVAKPKPGDSTPHPVTDDELAQAIALSPEQPWRFAVLLCAYEGLRCGEAARLLRSDVTEDSVYVCLGKGGKSRYVPTHSAVWAAVKDLPPGQVLTGLVGQDGGGVTPQRLTVASTRHWAKVGLPQIHLHRLRHWFGTKLVDSGVGIEVVSQLMGHASVSTTQGYCRVAPSRRAAAVAMLPSFAAA